METTASAGSVRSADRHRAAVAEAAQPPAGVHGRAEGGQVDDADHRAVLVEHGQQVGVEGNAPGEGLGAVDGVDHPGQTAGAGDVVLLLAEDGVVGMSARPARLRMRRSAARSASVTGVPSLLVADGQVGPVEPAEGELAGGPGEGHGLVEQGRVGGGRAHRAIVARPLAGSGRGWAGAARRPAGPTTPR